MRCTRCVSLGAMTASAPRFHSTSLYLLWIRCFKLQNAVPVRDAVYGLPGALSLTSSMPVEVASLQETVMMQDFPGARVVPQVFV